MSDIDTQHDGPETPDPAATASTPRTPTAPATPTTGTPTPTPPRASAPTTTLVRRRAPREPSEASSDPAPPTQTSRRDASPRQRSARAGEATRTSDTARASHAVRTRETSADDLDAESPMGAGGRHRLTLRARVTVVAVVVLSFALALGAVFSVRAFRNGALDDLETAARHRTEEVVQLVRAGKATTPLPVQRDSALWVQVIDDTGHVVAATSNVDDMQAFVGDGLQRPVVGRTMRTKTTIERSGCVLYTTGVRHQGRVLGVYVAAPLRTVNHQMGILRGQLLRVFPLVLLAAIGALWFVVGRALRPVVVLRQEVEAISPRNLRQRVTQPPVDDEIGRLARTMNDMLGRLEAASESQSRFVSDASHELRSPLAVMRARLEVALRDRQRTDWNQIAAEVLKDGERMERLVSDLLLLARGDRGALVRNAVDVDLDELVLAEVQNARSSARARPGGEASEIAIDARAVSGGRVRGDVDHVRRVVANLLSNAVRHAKTRVEIALQPINGMVVLTISDDGSGVPVEERERIFERFTRLDEARARHDGGAGLGLAIVREIVTAHQGYVWVEEARGGGARFVVTIPEAL